MSDTDSGDSGSGDPGDGSNAADGGAGSSDPGSAGTDDGSGADPGTGDGSGGDPSTDEGGSAPDTSDGDGEDDGTGINLSEASYIAETHIGGISAPPRPPRQMPFVARHAGISSKKPHNIDAVSHAAPLAPAPPYASPPSLTNPAKTALDAAAGDLPSAPPTAAQPCPPTHWIEIVLVDQENQPVPDVAYRIVGPDGTVYAGSLDQNGFARVDGLPAGTCQVGFPDLEDAAWDRQGTSPR